MNTTLTVRPALRLELEAVLSLAFQAAPVEERAARVANALRLIRLGELDIAGILVRSGGSELHGAVICCPVPGASGLIWPPQAVESATRAQTEDALVCGALAWLRQRGAKLVQSLLTDVETVLAPPLLRNGFRHITRLLYMRHNLRSVPSEVQGGRVRLVRYSECEPAELGRTLLRTYDGTLDCPEVNGVRTIEEVLEGHRAQGHHNPARWWLALREEEPVGVLLLAEMFEWPGWDVSYVGVVPEARRHGIGRTLMLEALHRAQKAGVDQLTLSVDARNDIACQLYERLGFVRFDERAVFLAILA